MREWLVAIMITGLCLPAVAEQSGTVLSAQLDPGVRELLRQEMRALAGAVDRVPSRLAQGDWEQLEKIGRDIHDSFILKQKMSASQRRHLRDTLPGGFKRMDKRFHEQAATLANSAGEEDARATVNTFRDLLQACVDCHRQYAPERFPGLHLR